MAALREGYTVRVAEGSIRRSVELGRQGKGNWLARLRWSSFDFGGQASTLDLRWTRHKTEPVRACPCLTVSSQPLSGARFSCLVPCFRFPRQSPQGLLLLRCQVVRWLSGRVFVKQGGGRYRVDGACLEGGSASLPSIALDRSPSSCPKPCREAGKEPRCFNSGWMSRSTALVLLEAATRVAPHSSSSEA